MSGFRSIGVRLSRSSGETCGSMSLAQPGKEGERERGRVQRDSNKREGGRAEGGALCWRGVLPHAPCHQQDQVVDVREDEEEEDGGVEHVHPDAVIPTNNF